MILEAPVWPEHQQLIYTAGQSSNTASPISATFGLFLLENGSASAFRSFEERKIHALTGSATGDDSQNSEPATPVAVAAATEWLQPLKEAALLTGALWKTPHISVSECGEVTFEWWRRDRKITVYFGEGAPEFIKVWGPNIVSQMESGELQSSDSFRSLWSWLNAT